MTLAETQAEIRESLTIIRRCWPILIDPPKPVGATRTAFGSKPPCQLEPLSLIEHITRDLSFWVQAVTEWRPALLDDKLIHLGNALECAAFLTEYITEISGWDFAESMATELAAHARAASWIAYPPEKAILLGPCTGTVGINGVSAPCEQPIRAKEPYNGGIRCSRCGLTDTIDGWLTRMVGTKRIVTAAQAVEILHQRMGIRVTEATIRKWVQRGRLTPKQSGTENRAATYDIQDVLIAASLT